ncbi:hypothetical protein CASFOL_006575 [Castilleja foliolosa]|uniref:Uncharacterized protein n=1 Tax=Castilleja foliolosa TaxID=1961234 RepID=A0ABD3E7C2_9LAMI
MREAEAVRNKDHNVYYMARCISWFVDCNFTYLLLRGWDGVALIESALVLLVIVRRRKSEALLDVDE